MNRSNRGDRRGMGSLNSHGVLRGRIDKTHGVGVPNACYHTADLGIFAMRAAARPSKESPLTPVPVRTYRKPAERAEWPAGKGWDRQRPDPGPEQGIWV